MKIFLAVFFALCAVALAAPVENLKIPQDFDANLSGFHSWTFFHNKSYESEEEKQLRSEIWINNMQAIKNHNIAAAAGVHSFTMGMNAFGDLTWEEFRHFYLGTPVSEEQVIEFKKTVPVRELPKNVELPTEVDWRKSGAVTHVKNQGQCGSCWSFSTTGSVEGAHVLQAKKPLVSCSEQQLVDCSGSYGNQGCNGGLMTDAFQYIIHYGGLDSESAYPYTAEDGSCSASSHGPIVADINSYHSIASGSESDLATAVATVGPISVAIDAAQSSFQFYNGGVYYSASCSSTQLDHGVLAAGYGVLSGQDYWLVKNSWGASWGLSGYIYMAKDRDNNCGIATMASYPIIN